MVLYISFKRRSIHGDQQTGIDLQARGLSDRLKRQYETVLSSSLIDHPFEPLERTLDDPHSTPLHEPGPWIERRFTVQGPTDLRKLVPESLLIRHRNLADRTTQVEGRPGRFRFAKEEKIDSPGKEASPIHADDVRRISPCEAAGGNIPSQTPQEPGLMPFHDEVCSGSRAIVRGPRDQVAHCMATLPSPYRVRWRKTRSPRYSPRKQLHRLPTQISSSLQSTRLPQFPCPDSRPANDANRPTYDIFSDTAQSTILPVVLRSASAD